MNAFLARHERLAACIVATLVLLVLNRAHAVPEFPFDAATYWDLSRPVALLTFPSYRGYVFPALLMPLRMLSELTPQPVAALGVLLSLVYGVALATLVPAFFARAFGAKVTFWRRLVPVVLLAQLFPGVLIYPLSDLPALLALLGALVCALRIGEVARRRDRMLLAVAAGFLVGAAYNIRTIYMFAFPGLFLLAWMRGAELPVRQRGALLLAVALGLLLLALPQRWINQRVQGVATFSVMARVAGQSLFATQLVWGLTLQRYETAVRDGKPLGGIYYLDPAGEALFKQLAPRQNAFSIRAYLGLATQRPLEFLGLYARHVVNGLDVRDGTVYVEKASPLRHRTATFNFLVLACAVLVAAAASRAALSRPGLRPGARAALLATLLLPVAAVVPSAVESRFFLPVHLLAYAALAFQFDRGSWGALWQERGWWTAGLLALAAASFFAVSTSTMSHRAAGWPETYRHGLP
jgi:hypothetical protein